MPAIEAAQVPQTADTPVGPTADSRPCPRCGRKHLRPVETVDGTNLVCAVCHRCWQKEFGYLIEVNRYACPGCADRSLCRPI